jgi:peptide deformylase
VTLPDWSVAELGDAGRVLPVLRAPHPVLGAAGSQVDPTDPEIVRLAADLVTTMRSSAGCVGLAACQVGVPVRVFAVDVSAHPRARTTHGTFVLCNAEIVRASRWQKAREGCLSVPDLTGDVKRAGLVEVRGHLPGSGRQVTLTTDAFEARAVQHEVDHCAGTLFLDRVAGAHAIFARKVYL